MLTNTKLLCCQSLTSCDCCCCHSYWSIHSKRRNAAATNFNPFNTDIKHSSWTRDWLLYFWEPAPSSEDGLSQQMLQLYLTEILDVFLTVTRLICVWFYVVQNQALVKFYFETQLCEWRCSQN